MFNAIVALVDITNRVPDTYNTNEGWVVKKMSLGYANKNCCHSTNYLPKG
jgi:hypothetical protein